ncbi:MAG: hypothetical protein KDK89_01845 [Alphaproteobacteria bacterium]|nr:hypothetical protein [Alphaproteobacteria bacterium]
MRKVLMGGLALLLMSGSAFAGPFADFEGSLRVAYGNYRAALFMTNMGKAGEAEKALTDFAGRWATIESAWAATPPPQYADELSWKATLEQVKATAQAAADEVKSGDLAKAHSTLEAIRDQIGDLHTRNGIMTFSDRMNAYHEVMEEALGLDLSKGDAANLDLVHEKAAVLDHLARAALAHPPADGRGNGEFDTLSAAFAASVANLLDAVRSRDPAKIKPALGKLKPLYSKLFLKFG